jgi:hypothetical protein
LVAANLPHRMTAREALGVVGRGVTRTARTRPLALIQGSLSGRQAARRSPLLAGLHKAADGTLAGIGLCMLALSGLTLHWQNHWGNSFQQLESAQVLEHRLQESAALLEQHYLSAVRKPGWLVPTSSEKLIYLPSPGPSPAKSRGGDPRFLSSLLSDFSLADLRLSDLNPLASNRNQLPTAY